MTATWLALTVAAFFYVARFAGPDPFGDEWDLVPGTTYQTPYLPWLWAQHNEHRLPLPKLVYSWLLHVGPFDARAGGLATVAVLSGLSLALVCTARRLRSKTEYSDAFFPVAFLNWGHFENYLIGFQIGFALSVAFAIGWQLAALDWIDRRERPSLKWLGLTLVLLPLCGAHGLVYTPSLGIASLCLVFVGPGRHNATTAGRLFVIVTVAVSWLLTGLYFRGYQPPTEHPVSAGVVPSLKIATETLALAWGWCGQMTWPLSGFMIVGFILGTAGLLLASLRRDFDRSLVWLAAGSGTVALALGIGWGRSGFGPEAGFAVRYAMLMLPLVAAGYLAWDRFAGSLVPMGLFTLSILFLTQHGRTGLAEGKANRETMTAFATDMARGLPAEEIARRHPKLYPHADRLAARIVELRRSSVARYTPEPRGIALQSP
ncbi:MAG: hypothetical protein K1X57_12735 [Gemmataceae bacterium]|nr:hypothetical protein [Gemmataceae bacterium]